MIVTSTEQLQRVTAIMAGVASPDTKLPILGCVLIGEKYADAANHRAHVRIRHGFANRLDRPVCVDARRLADYAKGLPKSAPVTIDIDGSKPVVKCGRSRLTLQTGDHEFFPVTPSVAGLSGGGDFYLEDVRGIARFVCPCASEMQNRFTLNNVLLADGLAIATDSHRMAWLDLKSEVSGHVLIPSKAFPLVQSLMPHERCKVSWDSNTVAFLGDAEVYLRRVSGQFPNHEMVMPRYGQPVTAAFDDSAELLAALTRLKSVMAGSEYPRVEMSFTRGECRLRARNESCGDAEEVVACEFLQDVGPVVLNLNYLSDFVRVAESVAVTIERERPGEVAVLLESPGLRWAVMPVGA